MDYYTKQLLQLTDLCFKADDIWLETIKKDNTPVYLIKGTWDCHIKTCPACNSDHIVQHIHRNFNQQRVQVMKTFRTKSLEYRALKRFYKLLLKDWDKLNYTDYIYTRTFKKTMTETDIVDYLLSCSDRLKEVYYFIQDLKYAYKNRDIKAFMEVITHIPTTLPRSFKTKFNIFNKYHKGISKAFSTVYSNGRLEGINNKIKAIKRTAYGYRNFTNFKTRICLSFGTTF